MATNTYSYTDWLKGQYDQYVQSQNAGDAVLPVMPYEEFVRQQSGWANLDPSTDLSSLNYTVGVDGNNYSDTLTNQAGGEVANRDYQAEKWSFLNDMLLPALAVGAGGYFGFNALGNALTGGAAAGGAAGAAAGEAAAGAGAGASAGGAAAGGAAGGAAAGGMSAAEYASLFDALNAAGTGAGAGAGAAGAGAAGAGAAGAAGAGMTAADFATLFGSMPGYIEGTAAAAGLGGAGAALGSAEKAALYGAEGYGAGMTGAQTAAYDAALGLTGSKSIADMVANSSLGSSLVNGGKSVVDAIGSALSPVSSVVKPIADAVGGGSNLAALVGAGVGAATGGGSQTSSRDPWGPSQDFLKAVLGDAGSALTNLRQNPYTPQQTAAYSNAFAGLDQARSALPGLLGWGQSAMQRQSTTPSYAQLFGGGLLQQPTAQAGGGGGLLGGDDRMKALMARGQGLIG